MMCVHVFPPLIRKKQKTQTGWWFQPIWKILVKMWIFPNFRGENSKNVFSNHHLAKISKNGKNSNTLTGPKWLLIWVSASLLSVNAGSVPRSKRSCRVLSRESKVPPPPKRGPPTRWAPTSYKWSYKPYKWPYNWVTGVITPISGLITILITGRGPTLQ